MKGLLRNIWLGMMAVAAVVLSGCTTEPDPETVIPKIQITDVTSTFTSVKFTLTATDAVRYTYAVALEGETGTPTEVTGKLTSQHEVPNLEAGKKYVISAYAYAADGTKSEEAKATVETDPRATLKIDEYIEVSRTSAKVTLIPTNATSMSYVCYEKAAKPEELTWIKVEGNTTKTVDIPNLKMTTEYQVDAFATNADGDSDVVSATFTTTDVVGIKVATLPSSLQMSFDFDKEVYKGLYRSGIFDKDDASLDASMKSLDSYIAFVKEKLAKNELEMLDRVSDANWCTVTPGSDRADNTYQMYVVLLNEEGKLPETPTGYTLSVKQTAARDIVFGKGAAKAALNNVKFNDMTISYELSLSADAVWYEVGSLEAKHVGNQDIAEVVLATLKATGNPLLAANLEQDKGVINVNPETEYYIYAVAYDKMGRLSELVSQKAKTTAIAYDDKVTAKLEVVDELFKWATFKVTSTGSPAKIRYNFISKDLYENEGSDDKRYISDMYASWYDMEVTADETGLWTFENGLEYNTSYVLFTLPVKADGTFGTPSKSEFATSRYIKDGNGTVTLTEVDRGTRRWESTAPNGTVTKFAVNYVNYKVTPANCKMFMYAGLDQEIYQLNSSKLGMFLAQNMPMTTVSPAEETVITIEAFGGDTYPVLLIKGENGKWSVNEITESILIKHQPYFDGKDINGNPYPPVD